MMHFATPEEQDACHLKSRVLLEDDRGIRELIGLHLMGRGYAIR